MPNEDRCPKCGANERIPNVELPTFGGDGSGRMVAKVDRHPKAMFLKGAVTSAIRAVVCGQCGFIELYATEPGSLLSAHRESLSEQEG